MISILKIEKHVVLQKAYYNQERPVCSIRVETFFMGSSSVFWKEV